MNQGLELLMNRMDTHPEEFMGLTHNKWMGIVESYEDAFDPEDIKAFKDKYNAMQQERFTEMVMKKLFEEEEKPMASPFGSAAVSGAGMGITYLPTSSGVGTTLTNSTTTSQAQANQLAAQAQLAQQQMALNLGSPVYGNGASTSATLSVDGETLTGKMIKKLKKLIK